MHLTKHMLLTALLAALALLVGACGITQIQIVIVVTATPGAPESPMPSLPPTAEAVLPAFTPTPSLTLTAAPSLTLAPDGAVPPTASPLPPDFPTPVRASVQIAEQLFEGGRMFWLQPTQQIWVLTIAGEGRGLWSVYPDTFVEGVDAVIDPDITPPEGRLQPERGFGKLWREAPDVREALGWAVTPEFGYISEYAYLVSGTDANGAPVGYHVLYSLYGEQFRFNESDGTWQLGGG